MVSLQIRLYTTALLIGALLCIALDNKTKIPVENYKSRNLLQTVSVQDETHIQASNGESEEENNEKENTEKKRTNGTANSEQSAFRKEIPKGRKEANFEEVIPSRTNITEDLMGNDTKISSNGQRGSEYHVDVPDKTVQRNYTLQSTTVHSTNPLYSHHDIIIRQQQRKENEVTSIHSTLTMSPIQGSENRNENSLNRPLLDMTNVQQEIQNRSAPSQQLRKSGDAESLNFIHEIKSSQIFGNSSSVYIKNGKPFSHVGDEGLDDSIHKAIINVVKTIRNKNIYIVLQSQYDTDSYIVRDLWNGGLPVHIFESELWWEEISQLTYFHYTQHILLGPLEWIVSTMQKIKSVYNENILNAVNTQWIWIPTKPSQPKSPTRNPLPISAYFSKCVKEISQQLQEGIRGVLLVTDELVYQKRNDSLEKNTSKKSLIKIAAIEAPGDGSWTLKAIASWDSEKEWIKVPIWPIPSFNFRNRTIRMSVIQKPVVFEYAENGNLNEAKGYMKELMIIAREHLNFRDLLLPTQGFGVPLDNGSWKGMVGVLSRREADVAPLDFSPSPVRTKVVDFSYPVGEDILIILSKAPSIVIKPFLLLQIFSPLAWASLLGAAIVTGILLECTARVESIFSARNRITSNPFANVTNVLMIFVYHGSKTWPSGDGSRVAAAGVMFIALIIGSLYSGSITAFFAIPFRSKPLDSAEDLIASKVRPVVRANTQFYQTLLAAENGILYPTRACALAFTGDEISTLEFLGKLADGSYALADAQSTAVGRANIIEKPREKCKLYMGKVPLRADMDVLAFQKNSPIYFQFDKTLKWLRYYGIIEQIKKKYFSIICWAEVKSEGPKPMTTTQVQGAFYIIGIGLVLGICLFLMELLWSLIKG